LFQNVSAGIGHDQTVHNTDILWINIAIVGSRNWNEFSSPFPEGTIAIFRQIISIFHSTWSWQITAEEYSNNY